MFAVFFSSSMHNLWQLFLFMCRLYLAHANTASRAPITSFGQVIIGSSAYSQPNIIYASNTSMRVYQLSDELLVCLARATKKTHCISPNMRDHIIHGASLETANAADNHSQRTKNIIILIRTEHARLALYIWKKSMYNEQMINIHGE